MPLSMYFVPLATVVTCGHLEARPVGRGRYYGACRLGGAASRSSWVSRVRADHVALARSLQEGLAVVLSGRSERLWALKGRQLAATDTSVHEAVTAEMRREARLVLDSISAFLTRHEDDFDTLGTPTGLCRELFTRLIDDWIAATTAAVPALAADILERFPPAGRLLVDPTAADVRA